MFSIVLKKSQDDFIVKTIRYPENSLIFYLVAVEQPVLPAVDCC